MNPATCSLLCLALAFLGVCTSPTQAQLTGTSNRELSEGDVLAYTRGLLQQTSGSKQEPISKCVWDKEEEKCGMNPKLALDYLEKAPESPHKHLISSTLECRLKDGEKDCASSQTCKWDNKYGICEYAVDLSEFSTFRRCIGDAAVFLEVPRKSQECNALYTTKDSCIISRECGWDLDANNCTYDLLKVLTGIPSDGTLPRGLEQVLAYRADALSDDIGDTNMETVEDFREFVPSTFLCPPGVDQLICHVAEVTDKYLLLEVYCAARQASEGVCDEDYCVFDETIEDEMLQCRISKELEAESLQAQREAYISAVANPTSVAILRREFQCWNNLEKEACTGDCTWNKDAKQCEADVQVLIDELGKHPLQDVEDPVCHFVSRVFETGCVTMSMDECARKTESQKCAWDRADGICAPGPVGLMDILLEGDQDLNENFQKDFAACLANKKKESCL